MAMKYTLYLFIFSFCLSVQALAQETNKIDIITKTTSPEGWIIKTRSSAYQIIIENGKVKPVFYGPAAQSLHMKKTGAWFQGIEEIPVRGGFPDKTPMLEIVFSDNVRDIELFFVSGEVISVDGRPALKIVQKDNFYPLEVTSYIRVLQEFDIIEKWADVKNTGKRRNIKVENLQSGSIVLPENEYKLHHMAGKWAHELQPYEAMLTPGIKTLQSRNFKSFDTPPWYLVKPKPREENRDPAWFGTIEYSGNWRIDFEKFYNGNVQIVAGINFWDTHWNLKAGENFTSPKFISGYTEEGSEGASQAMQAYVRETVLPERHRNQLRPVLYNSWYATTFGVNEDQQLALAEIAREIGVELFVIDDGWFKGRIHGNAGLGDWVVDENKFPNGLNPLISKIKAMGMDFGIWVEPEMVNPDSDLYREHPDWVFHFPNRTDTKKGRQQLVLNLAKDEVRQYLLESMRNLLANHDIDYVKWDHNRRLSQPGWPDAPEEIQREVRIRYIENLYSLIEELRGEFPDVWFENCSSGGGRIDLGMMSRMDMCWPSDNSDPLDRIMIHYGYLNILPANTMVSWVSHKDRHQPTTLDFKFDVSMSGVLGIGYDLTTWDEDDKTIAKNKIQQYKRIRPLVQQGKNYRLVSPFLENRSALQYVAEDKNSAVLFCYNLAEYLARDKSKLLKIKGLNPDTSYTIEGLDDNEGPHPTAYMGEFLMDIGIDWPVKGANKSQVLLINAVKR